MDHKYTYLIALLSFGLAVHANAGFTSAGFVVGGDSRVGLAANVGTNPTGYTSETQTDVRSQIGGTGGTYLDPGAFSTAVQAGGLSFDNRRANTLSAADGTYNEGDTISMSGQSSANVINRDVRNQQYKGTAVSTVTFTGDIEATESLPGVAISYVGDYFLSAFAQNNAPGGYNNNSAYSSVMATLTLENVTAGTTAGQLSFIEEAISQIYCGPRGDCYPLNVNDILTGTAFIPISGQVAGDILRMTIDVSMSTDVYAKGFMDTSGGNQTAGGMGSAGFNSLDVTLLLIPEPASLALILVGTVSVGLFRGLGSRRKHNLL